MQQYFSENPQSEHNIKEVYFSIFNENFVFYTDNGVFSKSGVDKGTEILLNTLPKLNGNVLDMGCGYGVVGVVLKKLNSNIDVLSVDINNRAIELTKLNAKKNNVNINAIQSDGLSGITQMFNCAIINPPIRAGKNVIYRLFSQIKENLDADGILYIVIRTKQGAKSAVEYLKTLFNSIDTLKIKSGYRVLACKEPLKE